MALNKGRCTGLLELKGSDMQVQVEDSQSRLLLDSQKVAEKLLQSFWHQGLHTELWQEAVEGPLQDTDEIHLPEVLEEEPAQASEYQCLEQSCQQVPS